MTRSDAIVAATELGLAGHLLKLLVAYIKAANMETMLVSITQEEMGEVMGRTNISVHHNTKLLVKRGILVLTIPSNTYLPHTYQIHLTQSPIPVYVVKTGSKGEIVLRTESNAQATRLLREYKNYGKAAWIDIEEKIEA